MTKKYIYTMHVRSVDNSKNQYPGTKNFEAKSENIGWGDSKFSSDDEAVGVAKETIAWFNRTITNLNQRPRELVSVSKNGKIIYNNLQS